MLQEIIIRRLGGDDAATAQDAIRRFKGPSLSLEYLRCLLSNPFNYFVAAYVDKKVAGFVYAHRLNRLGTAGDHIFIYEIEVAKERQRRGVGRALIERVRQIDPKAECFVLTERTNNSAIRFYEATGATVEQEEAVLFVFAPSEK